MKQEKHKNKLGVNTKYLVQSYSFPRQLTALARTFGFGSTVKVNILLAIISNEDSFGFSLYSIPKNK